MLGGDLRRSVFSAVGVPVVCSAEATLWRTVYGSTGSATASLQQSTERELK